MSSTDAARLSVSLCQICGTGTKARSRRTALSLVVQPSVNFTRSPHHGNSLLVKPFLPYFSAPDWLAGFHYVSSPQSLYSSQNCTVHYDGSSNSLYTLNPPHHILLGQRNNVGHWGTGTGVETGGIGAEGQETGGMESSIQCQMTECGCGDHVC